MCISLCLRRNLLYWNHEDCDCHFNTGWAGDCTGCRHREQECCGLTGYLLPPEQEGCCHFDLETDLVADCTSLTPEMLVMVGVAAGETIEEVMERLEVTYSVNNGLAVVDLSQLPKPFTYGLGTESGIEDGFDWSEWSAGFAELWGQTEEELSGQDEAAEELWLEWMSEINP